MKLNIKRGINVKFIKAFTKESTNPLLLVDLFMYTILIICFSYFIRIFYLLLLESNITHDYYVVMGWFMSIYSLSVEIFGVIGKEGT